MADYLPAALRPLLTEGVAALGQYDEHYGTPEDVWIVRIRERGNQGGQWAESYVAEMDARLVADRLARATGGGITQDGPRRLLVTKNLGLLTAARHHREAAVALERTVEELRLAAIAAVGRGEAKTTVAAIAGISRPTLDKWISAEG